MAKLTVDGIEVEIEDGATVLQACEEAGKEIPRFCYHERLSIAGNCRMCLVEQENAPKPIASCAMPVQDGMVIRTDTPKVKKAREGVMEFLLINHPLDCPICDQGGECDLQDQSMYYGMDSSRYHENKRAVTPKYMGPLIKTIMTRCIHCTRCVRFATEVAGVEELGATGRGEDMEITTYLENSMTSELSGNVIDLCPVGALTSRPYAFSARPWELTKTESVDVMDAVGSNIRVDARQNAVMRVLPRLHEDVNQEWISDKTRFACDGLRKARLDRPWVRKDGKLHPADWKEAFDAIKAALDETPAEKAGAIAGDLVDAESVYALRLLLDGLDVQNRDCRQDGAQLDPGCRAGYLFNSTIAGIDQADACLIIGSDVRKEAPIINARIRERWLRGGFRAGLIGEQADLTYHYEYLGAGPGTLQELLDGNHSFLETLKAAEKPMIVIGQGALARPDGAAVLAAARKLAEDTGAVNGDWNGFNVLHTAAGRVGALDAGFVPGEGGKDVAGILEASGKGDLDFVYLLGADEIDSARLEKPFVVYQGHHGDAGVQHADVILPGAAYTEKDGLYVNTEGRVQQGLKAVNPPGDAREDWAILRALSEYLGRTLPFDSLGELRDRLREEIPGFAAIDRTDPAGWGDFGKSGKMDDAPFQNLVRNFYRSNAVARASETMKACEAVILKGETEEEATGTDG